MRNDTATFHVALLTVELLIPHAQSLKAKRSALRPLKERLRARFNAAVAELDFQDKWQHAVIGVCLLGNDRRQLVADGDRVRELCEEALDVQIVEIVTEWL